LYLHSGTKAKLPRNEKYLFPPSLLISPRDIPTSTRDLLCLLGRTAPETDTKTIWLSH
jgi:hypothetical protein